MGLITETDYQYYEGEQLFWADGNPGQDLVCTFNTDVTDGNNSPPNYIVEVSAVVPPTLVSWVLQPLGSYVVSNNVVRIAAAIPAGELIRIKLIETAVWNNYGGYAYVKLSEIIDNFLVGYVGEGKLIPNVKRTDVMFYAKRGLQEFSYDTLKSVKSQELSVPPSLSIPMPPDYVNYVQCSWIDGLGVKHIIHPTTLTSNPYETPLQDSFYYGLPLQDQYGENLEGTSVTEERWRSANDSFINGQWFGNWPDANVYNWEWWKLAYGQRYGLDPKTSNSNGWFTLDARKGKISFSSNLAGQLIIFDYISDGLAYDLDTKVPKMAEEALYMHIAYNILANRHGQPEYIVQRFKRDRRAALRNAKIRLSDIKLEAFTQVFRGKSKWIKH